MPRGLNTGKTWPRPYVLSIYSGAIEHGFVWVHPISQQDAASLRGSLINARRRSTGSNAALIPPEYHLVSVGAWEPLPGDLIGRLPVIYNALPDGSALPSITPAEPLEKIQHLPLPVVPEHFSQSVEADNPILIGRITGLDPASFQMDEGEVSDYVARMVANVKEKSDD